MSSCCAPNTNQACCEQTTERSEEQPQPQRSAEEITSIVREGYAAVSVRSAARTTEEEQGVKQLAEGLGYSKEELEAIPQESNMGLQCGNPTRLADLREGEVVVDLGSGGGVDVFLASRQVGPAGKAIGIDMTTEMVEQARATAAAGGYTNVEFLQGNITAMPLADNTADVIISNCVINLAPNKMDVFKEMFRVLKPGGRVRVSDIVLTNVPMPEELRRSAAMLVGCVAGAISTDEYEAGLRSVGFADVQVANGGQDLNAAWNQQAVSGGCSTCPATAAGTKSASTSTSAVCCGVPSGEIKIPRAEGELDINKYVYSGKVFGRKP